MTLKRSALPADDHPRYRDWVGPFRAAVADALTPGAVVLDIGGGRRPAIPRLELPPGARYIGLDLSQAELDAAPAGAYDETIAADITQPIPSLMGRVDLAVSWQVLEHVGCLADAIANVHGYLRPGGRFVAQLSGGRALFSLINRAIPHRVAVLAMRHVLGRDPELVFPAPYDGCTYSGLQQRFAGWSSVTIEPRYAGAWYLKFSPHLQAAYLHLEDMMVNGRHREIATHYLVVAAR